MRIKIFAYVKKYFCTRIKIVIYVKKYLRDRPQQRITPLPWPIQNGEIIYKVALRDKYSRGLSRIYIYPSMALNKKINLMHSNVVITWN